MVLKACSLDTEEKRKEAEHTPLFPGSLGLPVQIRIALWVNVSPLDV